MLYIVTVVECIIHLYIPQHTNLQYIFEVGTSDRIPIFRSSNSCRTKKTLSEYRTNIAIPLQLPDKLHGTSDSPIAIGLTEMYWTKNGELLFFLCVFLRIFPLSDDFFSRISAKTHMRCWRLYCAVGVPADASTVAGSTTISGIPAVAVLPFAVDVCDVPIVSAAVSNVLVESSCCCCWCPC